jgi:hypothetical protein
LPREIALSRGFRDLGRLAPDYHAVFSEDLGKHFGKRGRSRQHGTSARHVLAE